MTTATTSLIDFLLARIAEDEERARFVWSQVDEYNKTHRYEEWRLSWHDEYDLLCIEPDRAIAECESKRRIVGAYRGGGDDYGAGYDAAVDETMRLLALPYADHPDYDESWRP